MESEELCQAKRGLMSYTQQSHPHSLSQRAVKPKTTKQPNLHSKQILNHVHKEVLDP